MTLLCVRYSSFLFSSAVGFPHTIFLVRLLPSPLTSNDDSLSPVRKLSGDQSYYFATKPFFHTARLQVRRFSTHFKTPKYYFFPLLIASFVEFCLLAFQHSLSHCFLFFLPHAQTWKNALFFHVWGRSECVMPLFSLVHYSRRKCSQRKKTRSVPWEPPSFLLQCLITLCLFPLCALCTCLLFSLRSPGGRERYFWHLKVPKLPQKQYLLCSVHVWTLGNSSSHPIPS